MTLYEKLNDKYREGKQKGDYNRMLSTVDHLLSKGSFSTEEEACEFLGYDFDEYLNAKKQASESDI
ncbi:MAG: hypothetical protein IKS54_01750 [Erysipelotrichaceae bacterium]|nr:hypothetical protein [Erysipelotrichaceae bacterium]